MFEVLDMMSLRFILVSYSRLWFHVSRDLAFAVPIASLSLTTISGIE